MNEDAGRTARQRWLVFVLACAVSWLLYLHRYAWGVIRPALKAEDPSITDLQLGWLDALFNVTYALGQVPGGLAGDLFGPRLVLTLLLLLWSGSLAGLAWAWGFGPLAAARSAFGLAQAGVYPNVSKITQSWFPPAVRTTVQGVVGSLAGRAGGACAPLLVATLLMGLLGLSWRTSLLLLSGMGLLLAAGFWAMFRNRPPGEQAAIHVPPDQAAADADRKPTAGRRRTLAALLAYASASTFADQLYVFWVPQFLVEGKGLSAVEMGLFAGLPLWGGALGGAVGGVLNDALIRWTGSRRWGRAVVAFTGKMLAAVLITASLLVADGRWVMVVLLACKFFTDWSLATAWGAITDVGGAAAATVFGVVNTAGSLAAFAAGPVMGYLKQEHGWDVLFGAVAGAYVLAALCWLFIDSSQRLVADPGVKR
jgi:sugar phosphate permease